MNWRCSRDDAAETAAATAAVDAAAGLATAPGLASPVVSSPTEEIQVKCERSSTLTFFYLLSCVPLRSAKQIRHGTIGRVSDIAPHTQPDTAHPAPASTTGYPHSGGLPALGLRIVDRHHPVQLEYARALPLGARAFVDWTVETTSLDIWSWM